MSFRGHHLVALVAVALIAPVVIGSVEVAELDAEELGRVLPRDVGAALSGGQKGGPTVMVNKAAAPAKRKTNMQKAAPKKKTKLKGAKKLGETTLPTCEVYFNELKAKDCAKKKEQAMGKTCEELGETEEMGVGRRARTVNMGVSFRISAGSNRAGNDEEDEEDESLGETNKAKTNTHHWVKAYKNGDCTMPVCQDSFTINEGSALSATHSLKKTGVTITGTFELNMNSKSGNTKMSVTGSKGTQNNSFGTTAVSECITKCHKIPAAGEFLKTAITTVVDPQYVNGAYAAAGDISVSMTSTSITVSGGRESSATIMKMDVLDANLEHDVMLGLAAGTYNKHMGDTSMNSAPTPSPSPSLTPAQKASKSRNAAAAEENVKVDVCSSNALYKEDLAKHP